MLTKNKRLKTGQLQRGFIIDRAAVNDESRTVRISFSSEVPVERWFGNEILDHDPTSVRLARLQTGGPVLVDHDHRSQIGVIDSVELGDDRRGYADIRFGKSPRAEQEFQDVKDGIRQNVSVGYMIHKMILDGRDGDVETYRATDWEPLEISLVSVPADTSVGVGRSTDNETHETVIEVPEELQRNQPNKEITVMKRCNACGHDHDKDICPKCEGRGLQQPVDVEAVKTEARKTETKRVNELIAIGEKHNCREMALEFVSSGKSVDEMRQAVLDKISVKPIVRGSDLDLSAQQVQRYSLFKAIRAAVTGDWKDAGFERECSLAIASKVGRDARGFFVPFDVQQRTLSAAGAATGADMVGTNHLAGSFIDALIAESVIGKLGATFLPGLVGDVDIPALGAATFYWLTEDGDVTDSTPASRSVALSPKTVGGSVPMTRRFLKQSSPMAELVVERLLRRGAASAIDAGMIQGTGADGQPTGIYTASGVNTQSINSAGAPTWAETVAFESAVAADNALMGRLAYLATPAVRGSMKTSSKDTGSGQMIWDNNMVNGYAAEASTNVPANGLIFGNFEDLYVGLWGVLDLQADVATKAASGGLVLRVFQDVDCGLGNVQSFCIPA